MADSTNERPPIEREGLTIQEVSRLCAVGERTLRRMWEAGAFPRPVKFRKTLRWYRGDVIAWLRGGITGPAAVAGGQIVQVR